MSSFPLKKVKVKVEHNVKVITEKQFEVEENKGKKVDIRIGSRKSGNLPSPYNTDIITENLFEIEERKIER